MAFAKKSQKAEDLKQGSTGYINSSGIYDLTILSAFVDTSDKGSSVVNFFVENEGQTQPLYGNLRVTNTDGVENTIGMKVFNQLLVIADLDEVNDPVEGVLPIGKDEADKDVAILEDLEDIQVKVRVQMEYGVWNGNITEKKVIKGFYRSSDNATAEEVVNEANYGATFEKDQKYVNNITYRDDLTEEEVTKWIADGRQKGGAKASKAPATPSFGQKKKFSKK